MSENISLRNGLILLFHHIIDTKSLTLKEEMLMCRVWVKLLHIRCKSRYWATYKWDVVSI